jgi:holo-[acyl-carrier protein] synthase
VTPMQATGERESPAQESRRPAQGGGASFDPSVGPGPVLSVGVDLIELSRIRRSVSRYGERFLARIYTPDELSRYRDRLPELAARFAAKEAVSKALGVGLNHISPEGIGWRDVEVLSDPHGKPLVHLSGRAQALAAEQGLHQWAISLSHGREYAIAFVVATGEQ